MANAAHIAHFYSLFKCSSFVDGVSMLTFQLQQRQHVWSDEHSARLRSKHEGCSITVNARIDYDCFYCWFKECSATVHPYPFLRRSTFRCHKATGWT